jgi:hypothetical protein
MVRKRGTENVPAIVRLTEALELNLHLLQNKQERSVKMLNKLFRKPKEGSCTLLPVLWDTEDIYEEYREPIFSFILEFAGKLIHPDVIADLLLHLFGFQIRVGGLCSDYAIPTRDIFEYSPSEWTETSGLQTILRPSVCRVSIPQYLLKEGFVLQIEKAMQELVTYGHYLLQAYVPGLQGWDLHPDIQKFLELSEDVEIVEEGCSGCPGKKGKTVIGKPKPTEGKLLDSSKMISSIMALSLRHSLEDGLYSHPYRWFIHPLDDLLNKEDEY